jgi:hypothetical protein
VKFWPICCSKFIMSDWVYSDSPLCVKFIDSMGRSETLMGLRTWHIGELVGITEAREYTHEASHAKQPQPAHPHCESHLDAPLKLVIGRSRRQVAPSQALGFETGS